MLRRSFSSAAALSPRLARRLANRFLRGLALTLCVLMALPGSAVATDAKCVGSLLKSQAKLAKAWGKEVCSCIEQADADEGVDADACVLADLKGRIAKAQTKLFDKALGGSKDVCDGMTPAVGYPGPSVASTAARDQALEIAHAIFGDALDEKRSGGDDAIGKCRSLLCRQTQKLIGKSMKQWRHCVEGALKAGATTEAELVSACLGGPAALDAKGKYGKAGDKLLRIMDKAQCTEAGGMLLAQGGSRPTAVEYSVMLSLIIVVLLVAITALGKASETTLASLGDIVDKMPDQFDDGAVNNSHLVAVAADALIANYGSADLSCRNDGDGDYTCNSFGAPANSSAVALGRINGDALTDAVITTWDSYTRVCLQTGDGQGFSCSTIADTNARDVSMADLDLDGDLDAVEAISGATSRVCRNNAGTLSCSFLDGPSSAHGVAIANINPGADPDIVLANVSEPSRLCLRTTVNNYSCTTLASNTSGAVAAAAGDVNGDGRPDVVLATENGTVCVNNGNGTLSCGFIGPVPYDTHGVAVGNLDGDSNAEIVFANYNSTNRLCDYQVDGTYACRDVSAAVGQHRTVAIGDVDGNGTRDLAFSADGPDILCTNDGTGNFSCGTLEGTNSMSLGIALGTGLPNIPIVP